MTAPIVTRGFGFTVAAVVTAGFAFAGNLVHLPSIDTAFATLVQPSLYAAALTPASLYAAQLIQPSLYAATETI